METTPSSSDHGGTIRRLVDAIESRDLTVFATIDHGGAARDVGMDLPDEKVVVFGNPRAGTPLMQSDPRIGIELPLRILVWRDGDTVMLGYSDPRELASRYAVADQTGTLEAMAVLLGAVVAEAAA